MSLARCLWSSLCAENLGRLTGTRQLRGHWRGAGLTGGEDEPLRLDGLHWFARHPLYAASLVVLWSRIGGPFELATAVLGTLYIVIGTALEQRRLMHLYGNN